jgi:hypothetical protein
MFSQSYKQSIVLNSFKFKYERKKNGYKIWSCSNKTCKTKLILNDEKLLNKKNVYVMDVGTFTYYNLQIIYSIL